MIVLDTQAAVWLVTRPQRLSRPAADAIRRHAARNELTVASVTLMELGLMLASGEIRSTCTPREWLRSFSARSGAAIRELDLEVAALAAFLPPTFAGDPFDRLIAATAIVERAPLVTSDSRIQESGVVRAIWRGEEGPRRPALTRLRVESPRGRTCGAGGASDPGRPLRPTGRGTP